MQDTLPFCCICLTSSIHSSESVQLTCCKQLIHKHCLVELLLYNQENDSLCPYCRNEIRHIISLLITPTEFIRIVKQSKPTHTLPLSILLRMFYSNNDVTIHIEHENTIENQHVTRQEWKNFLCYVFGAFLFNLIVVYFIIKAF
jgi:hypothetical protein